MIHFVTFADSKMRKSRDRLIGEAKNSEFFNYYHVFGEENLPGEMLEYCKGKPGFGHYLWKPYVVNKVLNEIQENDILVWVDAGCTIQREGKQRFDEYIDMVNKSEYGNISFELCESYCSERRYTKADIFHHFDADDLIEGTQLNTTSFFLRNIEFTRKITSLWEDAMLNHRNLSEDNNSIRSGVKNHPDFFDNRQDQSIFSVIRRKYGTTIVPHPMGKNYLIRDEKAEKYLTPQPFFSELEANWCEENKRQNRNKIYPIVATRLRY